MGRTLFIAVALWLAGTAGVGAQSAPFAVYLEIRDPVRIDQPSQILDAAIVHDATADAAADVPAAELDAPPGVELDMPPGMTVEWLPAVGCAVEPPPGADACTVTVLLQ